MLGKQDVLERCKDLSSLLVKSVYSITFYFEDTGTQTTEMDSTRIMKNDSTFLNTSQ